MRVGLALSLLVVAFHNYLKNYVKIKSYSGYDYPASEQQNYP